MADETELTANRPAVDPEVMTKDDCRAFEDWFQSGAGAQQGGFPGAVRSRQEHDLADSNVEVDAREGWVASEQADGGAEVDSEGHAGRPRLPVPPPVPPRRPDPERRRVDLPAVLSFTGRILIILGLLILGFVGFELLGTNVIEARNQTTLREQLDAPPPPADLAVSAPLPDQPAPPPAPVGSAVAQIRIPRIGVDKAVVEGVDLSDLRKGPGHYANTPLPGQPGNAAIAGHRTTYGAPFFRLDEMQPGDPILVSTVQGAFRYEVTKVFVVKPSQVEVLETTAGNQLTLTTCNPRFSAAQRLIVVADLKGPAAVASPPAAPVAPLPADTSANPDVVAEEPVEISAEVVGASGDPAEQAPAALWAVVVLTLGLAGAVLGRLWRRWPARLVTALPFLVAIWSFYTHLAKAVPS